MMYIGIREAEANFARLLFLAGEGREIIITNAGRPVARLVPMTEGRIRRSRTTVKEAGPVMENVLPEFES